MRSAGSVAGCCAYALWCPLRCCLLRQWRGTDDGSPILMSKVVWCCGDGFVGVRYWARTWQTPLRCRDRGRSRGHAPLPYLVVVRPQTHSPPTFEEEWINTCHYTRRGIAAATPKTNNRLRLLNTVLCVCTKCATAQWTPHRSHIGSSHKCLPTCIYWSVAK